MGPRVYDGNHFLIIFHSCFRPSRSQEAISTQSQAPSTNSRPLFSRNRRERLLLPCLARSSDSGRIAIRSVSVGQSAISLGDRHTYIHMSFSGGNIIYIVYIYYSGTLKFFVGVLLLFARTTQWGRGQLQASGAPFDVLLLLCATQLGRGLIEASGAPLRPLGFEIFIKYQSGFDLPRQLRQRREEHFFWLVERVLNTAGLLHPKSSERKTYTPEYWLF